MRRLLFFIRRVLSFLRARGIKGAFRYMRKVSEATDVFKICSCVVDKNTIPFNPEDYANHKNDTTLLLNWVIPEMGVGSGGHINIFRFISNIENMGFHSRVYLTDAINLTDNKTLHEFIKEHFAILDSRVETFCDTSYMTFAHATLATGWQTAYPVKNFNNTISKFYFVQDFEPYFFPHGSYYTFAENTYKFGFRGITAGDWLKNKLHDEYGMKTGSFGFSYDKDTYTVRPKKSPDKKVFFYARPVTPRRDYELGMLALRELSEMIPDLTVVFAGWDVGNFTIPFKYENLGIMPVEKLADIYSDCDLCLVISSTNLSLLPLEVMGSGSVAVCSKGENSSWLVNDENAIMVDYDYIEMAKTMAYYLNNPDELARIRKQGIEFAKKTSWLAESEKVAKILREGISEDDK